MWNYIPSFRLNSVHTSQLESARVYQKLEENSKVKLRWMLMRSEQPAWCRYCQLASGYAHWRRRWSSWWGWRRHPPRRAPSALATRCSTAGQSLSTPISADYLFTAIFIISFNRPVHLDLFQSKHESPKESNAVEYLLHNSEFNPSLINQKWSFK